MRKLTVLVLTLTASLSAVQESPWIERPLALISTLKLTGETFDHLDSDGKQCHYRADNLWLNGSLYFAPTSSLSFEIEAVISKTKNHPYLIDSFLQVGRYALIDDALGDPFAWTIGASLREVFERPLHDPSAFHKGLLEWELHTAQGIEQPFLCEWDYRLYALEALGIGNSSPWLRALTAVEIESQTGHLIAAKLEGYYGFGNRSLSCCHFHGYGSLAYRILDASLYYRLRTDYWTTYELGLHFRPYARNAPYNRIALDASIIY